MNKKKARKLGRAIIVASLATIATSFVLFLMQQPSFDSEQLIFAVFLLTLFLFYFPLAWLIISRSPQNIIGWLFVTVISCFSIQFFGLFLENVVGIQGLWVGLVGNLWVPGLAIPITLMPLYFPDGRLLSPRWRVVLFAAVLGMLGMYVDQVLSGFVPTGANAASIEWLRSVLPVLQILFPLGLLGSLLSVFLRYRKSKNIARAQIKWLAFMTAIAVALLLLSVSTGLVEQDIGLVFFFSPPVVIALAIGLAILRYRLYDIDIIIRRTLSYTILTAVLGLIYFGGVVLLQGVFGDLFGNADSPLVTVISTLAIAALFNPLRERIQEIIDRRFFRGKFNAEKALADFAAVSRDEVDMFRLSGSLLAVVESTMQPDQTSLWLRDAAKEK